MRASRAPHQWLQSALQAMGFRNKAWEGSSSRMVRIGVAAALGTTGTVLWSCSSLSLWRASIDVVQSPRVLAVSPTNSSDSHPPPSAPLASMPPSPNQPVSYDFLVIGYGNAGQSAVKTLLRNCPKARIGVVDPLRLATFASTHGVNHERIDYFPNSAASFQPMAKSLELGNGEVLRYRHNILIATGSRGAPPPSSLIDPGCLDRILELRSTEPIAEANTAIQNKRPVLPSQMVRQFSLLASSQGATVGILGSGWEAVELAVSTARAGGQSTLLFGSAAPLCHILPRYLSTAVARRLEKEGIHVQERSLLRYVANYTTLSSARSQLELHAAKSFDLMETQRTLVDLLVVAPRIDGARGTAVLPINTSSTDNLAGGYNQPCYQSWSQLSSHHGKNGTVVCFADDGRLAVNAELCAASRVYAAGSVAKYPSSVTGHAHVAGEGSVDGSLAGEMAAQHMSREYQERILGPEYVEPDSHGYSNFSTDTFPIWRSDRSSYLSEQESPETTALSSIGIRALFVGRCDAERMATHGFWWTNQAGIRRLTRKRTLAGETAAALSYKRSLRSGQKRPTTRSKNHPVYGTGVVFYVDCAGKICGIMTWGLPYTLPSKDNAAVLNADLVARLKLVISTNGRSIVHGEALLSSHLADESNNIVSIARSGSRTVGSPLYRFTPAKPASIASIGMLRRKDQVGNGELLGEYLYVRSGLDSEIQARPQSLVYVYPTGDAKYDRLMPTQTKEEEKIRALDDNELRARPPKEETLWLRRGDARKMINYRQAMGSIAEANMKSGKFADGRDAVQQAKVPMGVQNAKHTVKALITGKSHGDSEDGDGANKSHD